MRSLTAVVDSLAAETPDGIWVKVATSTEDVDNTVWHDVTFAQLAKAVDFMTRWMIEHLGPATENEPVAYMGRGDIRYPFLILASIKTGHKIILTSPRNSEEGQLSLLESTKCSKFMHTAETQAQVVGLSAKCKRLATFEVPDLEVVLAGAGADATPYEDRSKSLQENDTLIILHSSGTTGLPKPIHISAGAIAVLDGFGEMPAPIGRRNVHTSLLSSSVMVSCMPAFHIMGIGMLARSIYHQGPLVMLPPGGLVTADLVMTAIKKTNPSSIICPPSILEDICNLPDGLDTLSTLDYVFYGGAPLARDCGDKISGVTTLQNCIGSTETLHAPCYFPLDPKDWEYFEWSAASGAAMEESADGLFELIVQQKFDRSYQPVFYNFPDLSEWRTKDLFERHPTKNGLWRYAGRLDDVLVLSNGEKFNPASFERHVEGHPWVKGALIAGTGKFQTSLIIEPRAEQAMMDSEAFIEELWPWIDRANTSYPGHARVWQTMVTIAHPGKPFKRSPKGSVIRRATVELYTPEIEELYRPPEDDAGVDDEVDGSLNDFKTLAKAVGREVRSKMPRNHAIDSNANFFASGLDSLHVLQISTRINRLLKQKLHVGNTCTPALVYKNPSINRLTRAILESLGRGDYLEINEDPTPLREEKMSAMIHKYTRTLPKKQVDLSIPKSSSKTVIITGTTGSLGTYLLHSLLSSSSVSHVYCLNRSSSAASKQTQAFLSRGLDPSGLPTKTTFLTADLSKENFGLFPEIISTLQNTVDTIILNAWPVDFNHDLSYFESGPIASTRRWIDFALSAHFNPHIIFVSSIASVGSWATVRPDPDSDDGTLYIPELFERDNSLPLKNGYGESKHVASAILAAASEKSGIKSTIVRTGQLGGPEKGEGIWNKSEWFPSLVATSVALSKIPSSLSNRDMLDWVPVDVAAQSIAEICLLPSSPSPTPLSTQDQPQRLLETINLVNPHTTNWSDLIPNIQEFYRQNSGVEIKPIPFADWIEELRTLEVNEKSIGKFPGLKLLEFYEGLSGKGNDLRLVYETERATELSASLRSLRDVDGILMGRWLKAWGFDRLSK